jgi:HlyD family secretion protein
MNATTVQNVVTYNTIIDFDNPEMKLFPGMTAYITIPVASAIDVLRVPNSALRYKPDLKAEEIRAIYKKFGIESAGEPQPAANHAAATKSKEPGGTLKQVNHRPYGEPSDTLGLAPTSAPPLDVAVLWKLHPDKTLEPVRIRSGITDHTLTEVAELFNGSLANDDELVTGAVLAGPKMGPGTANANRH